MEDGLKDLHQKIQDILIERIMVQGEKREQKVEEEVEEINALKLFIFSKKKYILI